jgi:hypothetical protein
MERDPSRQASPSFSSEEETAAVALSALVERASAPGVEKKDVDALLAGLARPRAADESRRARADLLHSVLKSRHLCSLKGSQGLTVKTAAARALVALGHPYALELPPEALDGLRQDPEVREVPATIDRDSFPVLGILVTLLGTAPAAILGPKGVWLAVPSLVAFLGRALAIRSLQMAGVVMLGLLSLGVGLLGAWLIADDARSHAMMFSGLGRTIGLMMMVPAFLLGLGAFLLRPPASRILADLFEEDEPKA